MKIKTRLEISAIFFIFLVMAVGLTLYFMTQQVNEAYEKLSDVDEIVERAFMLDILTGDYLVHQEERVITQWLNVHDSLSNHLARLELNNHEEQLILDEIRRNHEETEGIFSQLVAIYEEQASSGEESALRDIMITQLSVRLTDIVSESSLLSMASQERFLRTYQFSSLLVFLFVFVIAAGIGVNSFLIITTIGKPIATLHHGVEMIRSGNLNYKVGILAKDEIGQLSRDFDEMTEELRVRSKELTASEKKFRLFFENAPEYCYMISPEGNIIDINSTALSALGYAKEEMIGKPALTTIYAPSSRKKAKRLLVKWRKTGLVKDQELTIISKTGEERQVLLSVESVRDTEGEIIHSISVQRDITERKRIEEEKDRLFHDYVERLKELDCLYEISKIFELRLSLDETFEGVVNLLSSGWQYPEVACARIMYRGRTHVTENFDEFPWVQSADLMIDGENVGLVEVRYLKEMSENFEGPFLKEERALINEIAERLGRFAKQRLMEEELLARELKLEEYAQNLEGMVEDRTRELRAAQEQLVRRERLAVLGQLAGGVGHELRNPLGAIKNAVYFLNMVIEDPESEIKETLEILDREVSTSEKIISSILDFARAKPPSLRKQNINEILRGTLSNTSIPENIRVETQLDETIPLILADPDQLTRVFGNIILNAVQAMPRGGQITIKSETTRTRAIALSIADQGNGIPPENLDKIFEPLFTTKARGIGLGLAVTKTIVEGHGGSIEVESEVGEGSTFTIKLPIDGGKDE